MQEIAQLIRMLDNFFLGNTMLQLEIFYILKENVEAYSIVWPFLPRSLMRMGAGAAGCVKSAITFDDPALPVHVPEPYPVSERMVWPILAPRRDTYKLREILRRHVE